MAYKISDGIRSPLDFNTGMYAGQGFILGVLDREKGSSSLRTSSDIQDRCWMQNLGRNTGAS